MAIDEEFSILSSYLTEKRVDFLNEIENYIENTFQVIFSEKHSLKIKLDSKILAM